MKLVSWKTGIDQLQMHLKNKNASHCFAVFDGTYWHVMGPWHPGSTHHAGPPPRFISVSLIIFPATRKCHACVFVYRESVVSLAGSSLQRYTLPLCSTNKTWCYRLENETWRRSETNNDFDNYYYPSIFHACKAHTGFQSLWVQGKPVAEQTHHLHTQFENSASPQRFFGLCGETAVPNRNLIMTGGE